MRSLTMTAWSGSKKDTRPGAREIERMHRESMGNIQRAIAALRIVTRRGK